jgi:hypothetical protein
VLTLLEQKGFQKKESFSKEKLVKLKNKISLRMKHNKTMHYAFSKFDAPDENEILYAKSVIENTKTTIKLLMH